MTEADAPRIVGRYALYNPIAAGGMATIHIGRLLGPVGFSRTVAIKRLHEGYAADPEFVAMFLDEARIAARIRHPNVVSTLDVVTVGEELLLVMEFIQGESLSFFCKQARAADQILPLPITVHIMVEVLQGLHAAHEARDERGEPLHIIHRDVTPHNILIGIDGVARVVDFGIAKAAGRSVQTRAGQFKGKLQYMAPEQALASDLTRAVDIYAASVVLWEALTGQRLIQADNDVEVMCRLLEGQVDSPRKYNPEVSPALEQIVMRGLQQSPADRYATAREMALALDRVAPAISTTTVADWVQQNAHESLGQRARQIALVESLSAPQPAAEQAPISGTFRQPSGSWLPPAEVLPATTSSFSQVPAPAPRWPWVLGLGALTAITALGSLTLLKLRASDGAPAASLAAPLPPPAPTPTPTATSTGGTPAASTSASAPASASAPPAQPAPDDLEVVAPVRPVYRPAPAVTTPPKRSVYIRD